MGQMENFKENKEIQILEFAVNNVHFGVNIEKIQEVINNKEITKTPKTSDEVIGMFQVRDNVYTIIDLGKALFNKYTEITKDTHYILTNFDDKYKAFVIQEFYNVEHCPIEKILKPSGVLIGAVHPDISGIISIDKNIVSILELGDHYAIS